MKIHGASRLAQLIRQQARRGTGAKLAPEGSSAAGGSDLAAALRLRVAALDPTDPGRSQKALRIFFEAVLSKELGAHLVDDPAFQALVDQVQQELAAQPSVRELLARASTQLLGSWPAR